MLSRLGIPLAAARRAVQLAMPDGTRYQGAEAVFRVIAHAPGVHPLARFGRLPMVRWFAARVYKFVANHRVLASHVDRMLFPRSREVMLR